MVTLNLCDCTGANIQNNVSQCKSCGVIDPKSIEKKIQNQVGVSQSQMIDVKSAVTIGNDYLMHPPNSINYPFKNMSDRRNAHGKGVDVKHGSYARYLGKLKSGYVVSNDTAATPLATATTNNKQYRFSIINTGKCYNTNGKCLNIPSN
jgi:hypothetical protein